MSGIGRKVIIAGATALILTAGASAATAAVMSSGPVDSSGVIHGCWTTMAARDRSHVFMLQDAGTSCAKGTTAISWNMRGPTGPAGAVGPAGATGPSTAGSGGLGVTVVSSNVTYLNSDGTTTAAAFCPSSAPYVIGGSAVIFKGSENITQSGPYDFTTNSVIAAAGATVPETRGDQYGWRASAVYDPTIQFMVTAICSA